MSDAALEPIEITDLQNLPNYVKESGGFVIYFPEALHQYTGLYPDIPLKANLKEFMTDVLSALEERSQELDESEDQNESEYLSYEDITTYLSNRGKSSGRTMIYDRIKKLTMAGLFTEGFLKRAGRVRRVKILTFNSPIAATAALPDQFKAADQLKSPDSEKKAKKSKNKTLEAEQSHQLLKSQFGDQMLSQVSNRSYRDMLMSSMLSKCIRLDGNDDRKRLTTNFSYKQEAVDVITTTLTDGNIAISKDIRYTMVATTFALETMSEYLNTYQDINKKPENSFVVDLSDVCTHVGNKRTTGNRLTVYKAFKRLFQTNFEIRTPQESEFAERFLDGYNESNYRFLTDFRAIVHKVEETDDLFSEDDNEVVEEEISNPRYVKLAFWPATFDNMWDQVVKRYLAEPKDKASFINNFIQNPEVVKNIAPLTYHLFSHLSSWVGVTGYNKKSCTTPQLHDYMLKSSRYQNFVRSLITVFNSVQEVGDKPINIDTKSFTVDFYGYIVEGRTLTKSEMREINNKKGFYLTFSRNTEDKYIGDHSRHHQLKGETASQDGGKAPAAQTKRNTLEESKARMAKAGNEEFKKLREELGKNPNDPDIPKAQILTREDGELQFTDDRIFEEDE